MPFHSLLKNRRFVVTALLVFCAVLTKTVPAYGAIYEDRQVAAWGPAVPGHPCDPNYLYDFTDRAPVWEPHIAAGLDSVIAVFNVGWVNSNSIGFATGEPNDPNNWSDPNSWNWTEGQIPWYDPNDPNAFHFDRAIDPSIAHDPNTGDFLVAGLIETVTSYHIGVTRSHTGGGFGYWQNVQQLGAPGDPNDFEHGFDKPWLVTGEWMDCAPNGAREYYLVWWNNANSSDPSDNTYSYRRSVDGGETWHGSEIFLDPNDPLGSRVTGVFSAQPAVYDDGPLLLTYKPDGNTIGFLEGADAGDCNAPAVTFKPLDLHMAPAGVGAMLAGMFPPPPIEVSLVLDDIHDVLPGIFIFGGTTIGQVAADPNDPNVFYLAYHDGRDADPNNADVYLRRMRKYGDGRWTVSNKYRVNRDGADSDADQFLPALTVDADGGVHVIFYDDRDYRDGGAQDEDQTDATTYPKFDLYHTLVTFDPNDVPSFDEREVHGADPNEPALDYTLDLMLGAAHKPGEYIGITRRIGAAAADPEIWMSFSGTSEDDGSDDDSVIYAERIKLQ